MNVLAESFDNVQPMELKVEINNLAKFFLEVLEFRENVNVEDNMEVDGDENVALKNIVAVEESASKALVALILKLSEATFKPLYEKLYQWAADNTEHKQRNITFYRYRYNLFYNFFVSFKNSNTIYIFVCQIISEYSGMSEVAVRSVRRTVLETRGVIAEQQQHFRHGNSSGADAGRRIEQNRIGGGNSVDASPSVRLRRAQFRQSGSI